VQLATPVIIYQKWKTRPALLQEIDRLLEDHTEGTVARLLTERGLTTSHGNPFRVENIAYLRKAYGLKHRRERLRDRGFRTLQESATALGVSMLEIKRRVRRGEIETCAISDRNNVLYRCSAAPPPVNNPRERDSGEEVQYA